MPTTTLFTAKHGVLAASQIKAFDSTRSRDEVADNTCHETAEGGAGRAVANGLEGSLKVTQCERRRVPMSLTASNYYIDLTLFEFHSTPALARTTD